MDSLRACTVAPIKLATSILGGVSSISVWFGRLGFSGVAPTTPRHPYWAAGLATFEDVPEFVEPETPPLMA